MPSDGATLGDLFSDDDLGVYETDWIAWKWLAGEMNQYVKVRPEDEIEYGIAYWILTVIETSPVLDLPPDSQPLLVSDIEVCPYDESRHCHVFDLPRGPNEVSWSMIGIPADSIVNIVDWRLSIENSACAALCTLDEAFAAGLSGVSVHHLRRGIYREFRVGDSSQPWAGYWVSTVQSQPEVPFGQ